MNHITIKEYADIENISTPTVYKRINKGFIKTLKKGRNVFILVEDDFFINNHKDVVDKNENNEVLKKEIEYLKKQVEDLKKDKENGNKEKDNLLKTVFISQQTIQKLEYDKQEETEEINQLKRELKEEKNKSIWKRIFKK